MARSELLFGLHTVRHALARHPELALELMLQDSLAADSAGQMRELAGPAGVSVQTVPRARLDELSEGGNHQGVVLRRRPAPVPGEPELLALVEARGDALLLLVMDEVFDPHNLGACLRVANGAGADAVVVGASRGPALTPAARKVASGAADLTPLMVVPNLARALAALAGRGVRILGAAGEAGQSLFASDLTGPLALVIGAEDRGLRHLTRERCDALVGIPLAGGVDSLNLSTAAAVCLFEAVRQRRFAP